jgi:hypothetical protein
MARWFFLRGRLRALEPLERVQDAWRRVLSSRQASDGRALGACGSGFVVQCVRVAWLIAFVLSGTAPGCTSTLHHQPCEEFDAFRRSDGFGQLAGRGAIRGRWRRAQDEAWRAVGLPDANPRVVGGVRGAADGWRDGHRAG